LRRISAGVGPGSLTTLDAALRRIAADLSRIGARYALVGGLAVSEHTVPRFTRDVDLAVAVASDQEAERLVGDLIRSGYRLFAQLEHRDTGRFATARLLLPAAGSPDDGGPVIDLLLATCGIEQELVAAAETRTIGAGVAMPVARLGHLIALKLLSEDTVRRPLDAADLIALLRKATREDRELARGAIRLITSRGFARDKDLETALAAKLAALGLER
jgi:hypothetical protein